VAKLQGGYFWWSDHGKEKRDKRKKPP